MCDKRSGLVVHVAVAKGGNPMIVMSVYMYSELHHTEFLNTKWRRHML